MNNLTTPKAIILIGIILSVVYIFFSPRYEFQMSEGDNSYYLRLDTKTGEVCVGSVSLSESLKLIVNKELKDCE